MDSQLFGGVPSGFGSAQTYQSARAFVRFGGFPNQGCWSEVCDSTRSIITRRPSWCAVSTRASKSASVPNIGSTSQ
jgi:hypothetical protein